MRGLFILLLLVISAGRSLGHDEHPSPSTYSPQGQREVNILRDVAGQSNTPFQFGRTSSMQLKRVVVAKGRIWSSIDDFTRLVHQHPNSLDFLVASVRLLPGEKPRVVTLHASFACMDRGNSTSTPIQFSGSRKRRTRLNDSEDTGFVQYSGPSRQSPDITTACLLARADFNATPWNGFSPVQAEHKTVHRGEPMRLVPVKTVSGTYLDDNDFFDRLYNERSNANESETVIYDSKENIPIVVGLPFGTGFKFWVRNNTALRIPQLPLSAVRYSINGQLESYRVDQGDPPTTSTEVWLNINNTGLQLIVACFIVINIYVQQVHNRTHDIHQQLHNDDVDDSKERWRISDRMQLFISVLSALILTIPIVLDAISGKLDSRAQFEVTTGASIFYGVKQTGPGKYQNFSLDIQNSYAGTPYIVSNWISVRKISNGHVLDLVLAVLLILVVIVLLTLAQTRDTIFPSFKRQQR